MMFVDSNHDLAIRIFVAPHNDSSSKCLMMHLFTFSETFNEPK